MPTEANAMRDRLIKAAKRVKASSMAYQDSCDLHGNDGPTRVLKVQLAEAEAELAAASQAFDEWMRDNLELAAQAGDSICKAAELGYTPLRARRAGGKDKFIADAILKREAQNGSPP